MLHSNHNNVIKIARKERGAKKHKQMRHYLQRDVKNIGKLV